MADTVHFPYRSASHLALLHVVQESGSWEKHGLHVEYNYFISLEDAHEGLVKGDIQFVSGNHISTYARRVSGDRWVYVGQTANFYPPRLITRADSGISSVADLRGRSVAVVGYHPRLNTWLFLKQHGLDADSGDVKLQKIEGEPGVPPKRMWDAILDGSVDAGFVIPPADLFARRAGVRVIEVEPLPMIHFSTLSTQSDFVEKHPDIVERFLKGMIEGIAFFKTRREETIKIIQTKYDTRGEMDDETVAYLYDETAKELEAKPYATLEAISNVYQEAVQDDEVALKVNPTALWDFHHLRKIDDSGFIDALYEQAP